MTAGLYSIKKSKDESKKSVVRTQHKSKENNTDYSNTTVHYVHTMHVKCQPFFPITNYNIPKSSLNIPPQPGWEARPPFG